VQTNLLQKLVARSYFATLKTQFANLLYTSDTKVELDKLWYKLLAQGLVLQPNLSAKKDFTEILLSFYTHYSQPTLLFLGNLSSFSLQMQEGMLKLLEEPPKNLQIILFAQNRSNILPTIASRCWFHNLKSDLVIKILDQNLLAQTQKKLPPVLDFCRSLLSDKKVSVPDLKIVEREELNFWLWQVQFYLENFYKQQPDSKYFNKLTKIIEARKLNEQNLQKKFIFGWLNLT